MSQNGPQCDGGLALIAFHTEADPIQQFLSQPATSSRIAPDREAPDRFEGDLDQMFPDDSEATETLPKFDKLSGQTICAAKGRPKGGAQGCAL